MTEGEAKASPFRRAWRSNSRAFVFERQLRIANMKCQTLVCIRMQANTRSVEKISRKGFRTGQAGAE